MALMRNDGWSRTFEDQFIDKIEFCKNIPFMYLQYALTSKYFNPVEAYPIENNCTADFCQVRVAVSIAVYLNMYT